MFAGVGAGGVGGAVGLLPPHAINDPIAAATAAKRIARVIAIAPYPSAVTESLLFASGYGFVGPK